jgi:hypothetical protein
MSTISVAGRSSGVLGMVLVCAACMVYYHLVLFVPTAQKTRAEQGYGEGYSFGADFYPIWFIARESLLHHRDPYSPEMTRQIQVGLFGRPLEVRDPESPPDSRPSQIHCSPNFCSGPLRFSLFLKPVFSLRCFCPW